MGNFDGGRRRSWPRLLKLFITLAVEDDCGLIVRPSSLKLLTKSGMAFGWVLAWAVVARPRPYCSDCRFLDAPDGFLIVSFFSLLSKIIVS